MSRFTNFTVVVFFVFAASNGFAQGAGEKILQFPSESVGEISVIDSNAEYFKTPRKFLSIAQGTVRVPTNKSICFEPNARYWRSNAVKRQVQPQYIEHLKIRFNNMDEGDDAYSKNVLKGLNRFINVKTLDFDKSDVTDATLSSLDKLNSVSCISATGSLVNLSFLKNFPHEDSLRVLRCGKITVNNASLVHLKKYRSLSVLILPMSKLSPQGLESISQCRQLRKLDISKNRSITDGHAPLLAKLTNLKTLNLSGTNISFPAVSRLAKALPQTEIHVPGLKSSYTRQQIAEFKKLPNIKISKNSLAVTKDEKLMTETKILFAPTIRE